MGVIDFFTNGETAESKPTDVKTPAFSATKVHAALGALVVAILGVVPAKLSEDEQIVIAAIAAGTAILLGMFGLVAVDIRTRQKAREAALRWGGGDSGPQTFPAVPTEDLVLQKGHNAAEYEVKMAFVEEGAVRLVAARNGELVSATFKEAPGQP